MFLFKHFLLLLFSQATLFSDHSGSMPKDILATVKATVQNIKNSRDAQALKQMDIAKMSAFLLEGYTGPSTNQQQAEFANLVSSYVSKYVFTHLRNTFKEASTITYGTPEINNDKAALLSTFKILHPVKNQEIKLIFSLTKMKKGWKITDFTYVGDRSILANLRDDKIRPLLTAGGLDHLLNELRKEQ
jgi:phospholipid transport system substrate-binding protein